MKILVIPDIHLKPWIFDRAEEILRAGKADRAVCLMDIADDWEMYFQIGLYEETYDRAIAFAKAHPETVWCCGNHDISYEWGRLETGYSPYAEATVIRKLRKLTEVIGAEMIPFAACIDKVLFSHGGIGDKFVERLGKKLGRKLSEEPMANVIEAINTADPEMLWDDDSPLWLRPQYDSVKLFRGEEYTQVVGHTPVEEITLKRGVISTDVFSTYRDGRQIGEKAFAVVDSETGTFEKVWIE